MKTVACVLRSGGDFLPEHVLTLLSGIQNHWPENGTAPNFAVLTDTPSESYGLLGPIGVEKIPLLYDYPKWWSKMELFRPDLLGRLGNILYFDLDTVIVGDLTDIVDVSYLTLLEDFYRPTRLASGLMYLPAEARAEMWQTWERDGGPAAYRLRGDQEFLHPAWDKTAERWQRLLPGQIVSAKVHIFPTQRIRPEISVICFHGRPRPWNAPQWFWEQVCAR